MHSSSSQFTKAFRDLSLNALDQKQRRSKKLKAFTPTSAKPKEGSRTSGAAFPVVATDYSQVMAPVSAEQVKKWPNTSRVVSSRDFGRQERAIVVPERLPISKRNRSKARCSDSLH